MKIVMLVHELAARSGGGERFAAGLAGELARRGDEVTLVVTRDIDPSFRSMLEGREVEVLELGRDSKLDLRAFRPVRRMLDAGDVDVLHSHMFGSNVWGALFGRLHRVPVVVAQEQTWSYEGQYHRKALDFLIGRTADAFVAVSQADAERMKRLERVPEEKVYVIPNAFIPRDEGPSRELRDELGIDPDIPLIGSIAQLRPQKALGVMLEALAMVQGEPLPHLAIAGDGECREELEARTRALGVEGRVHFLGVREDITTLITSFDLSVLSSDFEGTPLFVVESMSLGTPVVATRVGGLPDQITSGEDGVLVPPQNPEALARGLESLLADRDRLAQISKLAMERSREWSLQRIGDRFQGLYRTLIAAKATA
jgi:glycosyltransferase involved in cell wall biosynthesis